MSKLTRDTDARAQTPGAPRGTPWIREVLVGIGLLLAVAAAYSPALRGGLLWDDDGHITPANLQTLHGLWRIWTEPGATQQYYPLLHSAFWLEHMLWGDAVLGYHAVNLVLHSLSAWLLYRLLQRLSVPAALFGAALFALHPVCVESVAWISEQKNTLSGALCLGSALAYMNFDERRSRGSYVLATVLFVLALLAKSVTATLGPALLVIVWWKRGKIEAKRDVAPLAPWIALGLAGGAVTAWVERAYIGAQGAAFAFTLGQRLLLAGRAPWFYLGKLLLPSSLAFIYPRWDLETGSLLGWLPAAASLAALGLFFALRSRSRAPLAGALLYLGMLSPSLGFVNVYPFVYSFVADHFQYLAAAALLPVLSAALARLAHAGPAALRAALALAVLGVLGALSFRQSGNYVGAEVLWRSTLERNPDCWMAHENLGGVELAQGHPELAEPEFRRALALNPSDVRAKNQLGVAELEEGRPDLATALFREALAAEPENVDAHINLGVALLEGGSLAEASGHFRQALSKEPRNTKALKNLASACLRQARWAEAVDYLQRASEADPSDADALENLGSALLRSGRGDEAGAVLERAVRLRPGKAATFVTLGDIDLRAGRNDRASSEYHEALRLSPELADAHAGLASLLAAEGRNAEAEAELRSVVRLRPTDAQSHNALGGLLMEEARPGEALAEFDRSLELQPDFQDALVNRANLYLLQKRAAPAIRDYSRALAVGPETAKLRNNLGIALAGAGRIHEAVQAFRRALEIDPSYSEARRNLAIVTGQAGGPR